MRSFFKGLDKGKFYWIFRKNVINQLKNVYKCRFIRVRIITPIYNTLTFVHTIKTDLRGMNSLRQNLWLNCQMYCNTSLTIS